MKKILNLSFVFLFVLGFTSCSEDDNDTLTGDAATGGLLQVQSNKSFIQGANLADVYTVDLSVFHGREKVDYVEVYKQYFHTDAVTEEVSSSNSVLQTTFSFPVAEQFEEYQLGFNYSELISGIVIDGNPLPADDNLLSIGDYWILTYVSHLTDGTTVHTNAKTTKITVSCGSFLGGNYLVNYTSGPEIFIVTDKGDGLYEMNTMLGWRAAQGYITEFTDVCDVLTFINPWYFSGNEIGGVGAVLPNGDISWTDVYVDPVYAGRAYYMTKQ